MEQECIEDFIKLSQNMKTSKNDVSKEESIITTSEKRKECENRAIKIVELLLEGAVRTETFQKSIVYLNSAYYQDIVEERALIKLCGYALCNKKLKPVCNKRYSISTKNNKVYDLNEYGYYCSIYCFNASNHVKNQIDDSPLWLRDFEKTPTFSLLSKKDSHFQRGVDLKSKVTPVSHGDFVPVTSFAELSLNDIVQIEDSVNDKSKHYKLSTVCESKGSSRLKKCKQNLEMVIENDTEEETYLIYNENKNGINDQANERSFMKSTNDLTTMMRSGDLGKNITNINITSGEEIMKQTSNKTDNTNFTSHMNSKQIGKNMTNLLSNLKKSQSTDESKGLHEKTVHLKDLTAKIKNKFTNPKVKLIDPLPLKSETFDVKMSIGKINGQNKNDASLLGDSNLLKLKFSQKNSLEVENQIRNSVRKWISIDTLIFIHGENKMKEILNEKKLNEYYDKLKVAQLELTQQFKYANICKRLQLQELIEQKWDSEFTSVKKLKPVPDFTDLRKEKRELDIKVKHFLGGMLYEADDSNFPLKDTHENEEEGVPVVLPLVDVNSQNALRRRVLLGTLNKSVKFFLNVIKCKSTFMFIELQDLVKTFKLTADNVVFKPVVSDYLGFICLKILSLRDDQLRHLLETREAIQYEKLIFDFLPGKDEVLNCCLNFIENVDIFIGNYIICET